jgi:hypothetical protein
MKLYVDGQLSNVRIALGAVSARPDAEARIGGGGEGAFEGEVDELRVWGEARGDDEVRASFREKLSGSEPGLSAYFSMDEGAGQAVLDAGPARRHAVLGLTRFSDLADPAWEDSSSPVRRPDPEYALEFDPPGPRETTIGEELELKCVLSCPSAGGELLRGWSFSVKNDRLLAFLLRASLEGSDVEGAFEHGFSVFETVDERSATGFISRAVLDPSDPPVRAQGRLVLATAGYRSLAPRQSDRASTTIRYEEGLRGAAGLSRDVIQVGDRMVYPREGTLAVAIRSPEVVLGFSQDAGLRLSPGAPFQVDCTLTVADNAGDGPQSWSISVKHDPHLIEIMDATTSGTVVDAVEGETSVFEITELVNNDSGSGFLSAIILSMDRPFTLPPNGEQRIARARYRVRPDAPVGALTGIAYRDGLQQSGVPIENLVVFQAGASEPEKSAIPVWVSAPNFIRGDLNSDHRLNLSDAVGVLLWLFTDSPGIGCLEAGDANDDGRIDIADPVYVFRALFQGGRPPPPPFPQAGPDPTPDGLGCDRPPF